VKHNPGFEDLEVAAADGPFYQPNPEENYKLDTLFWGLKAWQERLERLVVIKDLLRKVSDSRAEIKNRPDLIAVSEPALFNLEQHLKEILKIDYNEDI